MTPAPESKTGMLRHALATLAYRGGKSLREAPPEFATFRLDPASRMPGEIVAHMGDLLDWALTLADGRQLWHDSTPRPWEEEMSRFFAALEALDRRIASGEPLDCPAERLFQGPIADALTHVGQMAMLRRVAGAPMKGENYYLADISAGRVGPDQAKARREFD